MAAASNSAWRGELEQRLLDSEVKASVIEPGIVYGDARYLGISGDNSTVRELGEALGSISWRHSPVQTTPSTENRSSRLWSMNSPRVIAETIAV